MFRVLKMSVFDRMAVAWKEIQIIPKSEFRFGAGVLPLKSDSIMLLGGISLSTPYDNPNEFLVRKLDIREVEGAKKEEEKKPRIALGL